MELKKEILNAVCTSLIDKEIESKELLRPDFVYNDHKKGMKVISTIISELNSCDEFIISVAFITDSGLALLLNTFKYLEEKGIKGKILTTNYLNFNEAKSLRKLKTFSNIEVRVCTANNFHSKGYIFRRGEQYTLLIGSSNITQNALTLNNEWNLRIVSLPKGKLIDDILQEFKNIWDETPPLTDEWLDEYENKHLDSYSKFFQSLFERIEQTIEIKPNKMQKEALEAIEEQRRKGINKTLVISATGTGKTYLAAFDVKQFNPNKMLFVVHREQIARDAERSFRNVLGSNIKTKILAGGERDIGDANYIFCTIQTLSKDEVLNSFSREFFDYICIDEVHRAGAASYQKIINYFIPKFMLGMSATPERTDGFNIYEMFDYNIAYEIRLQKALEENMLCPFHYFGVSELIIDGVEIKDETEFRYLTAKERVNHIIEKIHFYGYSGPRVRGLIFCSSKEECHELSKLFNEKGFQTIALTGENTQDEREDAVRRLELPVRTEDALDYIFTVDIFNEGVDIPKVNQVVMLRPTESAIIFVQQLGRGLRLDPEKEYLVVIDFIANYKKNFLIPIALSGDRTYNRDTLKRFVMNGTSIIPGASTIHFDEVSKRKIYESIERAPFSKNSFIKNEYLNLKFKLNKIPTLVDFYKYGAIDPELIFECKSTETYYHLLYKFERENIPHLSNEHVLTLKFLTREISSAKRVHEIIILKELLNKEQININKIHEIIKKDFNRSTKFEDILSAINVLNSSFQAENNFKLNFPLLDYNDDIILFSAHLKQLLENNSFKEYVRDLLEYSLLKYQKELINNEPDTNFVLYQKYTRKEVIKLLNWEKNSSSATFGYLIKNNTCPIFVTYHKGDDFDSSIKYSDQFIDHFTFKWISKNRRTLNSRDVVKIINSKRNQTQMFLFVQKNKSDKKYYYLGQMELLDNSWQQITMKDENNQNIPAVSFIFKMKNPVRNDIYEYIITKE